MLQNLNKLVRPIQENLREFNRLDCTLPADFKDTVKRIGSNTIIYGTTNSCAINQQGQRTFISNTWFYIASMLSPLYAPFNEYRNILRKIVDDKYLKEKDNDKIISLIGNYTELSSTDKDYLIKFATEQQWWNGGTSSTGKTLDRNDCLTSSILAIANVVNASQGFIAELWKYFGENPASVKLLNSTISTKTKSPLQKIYFGTPGSGKSYRVKEATAGQTVFRTTFHPDSDYSTFVGSYKPEKDGDKITYTFVPQAFTDAYIEAYKEPGKDVYLIIEEINRGNCAQIFGDLFQLLDRNDNGESEYPITPDKDLADYITSKLHNENGIDQENRPDGLVDGKLRLPSNLHIIATMNTSDQSLFPMDSAFKRRWEWEYVPIEYSNAESSGFTITIGAYKFGWIEFLKAVNERIRRVTESEDKQLGNFFIKSSIDEDDFKSKVMFYLWSEVCKDEYMTEQNFMRSIDENDRKKLDNMPDSIMKSNIDEYETEEFSFNDLFTGRGTDLLLGFMYSLNVLPLK
mgnify:CR=1 FL=1